MKRLLLCVLLSGCTTPVPDKTLPPIRINECDGGTDWIGSTVCEENDIGNVECYCMKIPMYNPNAPVPTLAPQPQSNGTGFRIEGAQMEVVPPMPTPKSVLIYEKAPLPKPVPKKSATVKPKIVPTPCRDRVIFITPTPCPTCSMYKLK